MITTEEYLKAKKIVEQYEDQEYTYGMNNAMYCVECQALNPQECFCEDEEEQNEDQCEWCNGATRFHSLNCPIIDDDE